MLAAYLDESGIHDGAPICVVAGYFAGVGQWRKFEPEYRRILEHYNVPLSKMHAKDLVKRGGFFHDWSEKKKTSFLRDVARVVANHREKIHPVSQAISVEHFNSFSPVERRFLTGATLKSGKLMTSGSPTKAYFVPFSWTVKRVCEYAPKGGRAHFFFGLGTPFAEYAVQLFKDLQRTPLQGGGRERMGNITIAEAKATPELQISDLFCYLTYHHAMQCLRENNWNVPPSEVLSDLLSGIIVQEDCVFINSATLKSALAVIPEAAWGDLRVEEEKPNVQIYRLLT